MTLNVNLLLCRPCYVYCYQTAEAKVTLFSLHVSYSRIKFNDEI